MVYLSSPVQGGHTIFPQLSLSVKPIAGTAMAWLNTRSSGLFDTRVLHMGCPVLRGDKWVANKWVLASSQMWRYPCYVDTDYHYSLAERGA